VLISDFRPFDAEVRARGHYGAAFAHSACPPDELCGRASPLTDKAPASQAGLLFHHLQVHAVYHSLTAVVLWILASNARGYKSPFGQSVCPRVITL
jgi:hypothetical protein